MQEAIANIEKAGITPNKKQMECIKALDGPVMVLAGPGTGKTFTIIQRVKYMLEAGIAPESILCLTYSEAAANEMKARLVKEAGTAVSAVTVHTYHAFCAEIIKQNPMEFELLEGVGLIDDITKRSLMTEAVDEFRPEAYRTKWGDAYHFIPELLNNVDEIKKNQATKEEYFNTLKTHPDWGGKTQELENEYAQREAEGKLVKTFLGTIESHNKKMAKAREMWEIYEIYDRKIKQKNFIDFNDMINLVLETFDRNEEFLRKVAADYKYFLVDEYQDTNYAQNKIVFKLAEGAGNENIFVVGDDDQIIYEFQGAKTDTLEKFLQLYPQTKVICLDENNRSTQTILDLSYNIIAQDETRLEFNPEFKRFNISKKLTATNAKVTANDKKAQVHCFADLKQENNFIVDEIEKLTKSIGNFSQIAVLTRENEELREFAQLLEAKNIPYQIKSSKSIFELRASILTYFYLKIIENHEFYADKLFGLLISKPFDFELADYNFLLEQFRLNHKDFITNIRENYNHNWANKIKVMNFLETFDALRKMKSGESLKNLVINVINKTGILQYFMTSEINRNENILALKRIADEAASFTKLHTGAGLGDFISHLDMAFEVGIPVNIDKDEYTQNAVQLVTLHGAKGREFEYVFMPNLIAKKWEKKRGGSGISLPVGKNSKCIDEDTARKSEQLRLLFVGVTRAKHSLHLSYSNIIENKPQELTAYLSSVIQNRELCESIVHELDGDKYIDEVLKSLHYRDFDYKTAFKDELQARIKDFTLSPSSLNSYLGCPRSFLYSNILKIPVPEKEWDDANYGNAVHKTLHFAVQHAKESGRYPDKEAFYGIFVKNLGLQKFETQAKREELETRGKKSLDKYYHHFIETPVERIYRSEFPLNHVPVGNYFVKGFVDRIEKNADGTYAMYDYKTGSAKSKSQITDSGSYEGYLNQLRFYKFAFESLYSGAQVSKVGLIFVEEVEGSYYTQLTKEDNEYIREKITGTYENINSLNFDPVEQSDKNCDFCAYKQLCRLDII